MARLVLDSATFFFECTHAERELPRAAGFRWSKERRTWFTLDLAAAVRLREYATGSAKIKINRSLLKVTPWSLPLPPSPKGLALKSFQKTALRFALERNCLYLALDPGLGKTPIAAHVAKAMRFPCVYITPPFLVRNVEAEFKKWAPDVTTAIYGYDVDPFAAKVLILPDSQLTTELRLQLASEPYGCLFVDEAHRFKSADSNRTISLFGDTSSRGYVDHFDKRVFMSGTPMPNRPLELYPLLSRNAPETIDFMTQEEFGVKYCGGARDMFNRWDFTGATNVKELAKRVVAPRGPFMLRMKKELLKLPPMTEEVFTLSPSKKTIKALEKIEADLPPDFTADPDVALQHYLKMEAGMHGESELFMATYLRLLGELKAPLVVEYIRSILEETNEKILLFAHHKTTIAALRELLEDFEPLHIVGGMSPDARQHMVDEFQERKSKRLLIGALTTMVGFTLTRASRVFNAEPSWVPAVNDQAAGRAHRYGQKGTVLHQLGVFPNSLDGKVIAKLVRKREVTQHM